MVLVVHSDNIKATTGASYVYKCLHQEDGSFCGIGRLLVFVQVAFVLDGYNPVM